MTQEMGETYSMKQDELATLWETDGPDAVHRELTDWTEHELLALAMCNIGVRALGKTKQF